MKTPQEIIDLIREDCPCTYNILNEYHLGNFPIEIVFPHDEEWDQYYLDHPEQKPTHEQLLELLLDYSGDNYDTHYWAGRYAQMKEPQNISIPCSESDLEDLRDGTVFEWDFDGIHVTLFNEDLEGNE